MKYNQADIIDLLINLSSFSEAELLVQSFSQDDESKTALRTAYLQLEANQHPKIEQIKEWFAEIRAKKQAQQAQNEFDLLLFKLENIDPSDSDGALAIYTEVIALIGENSDDLRWVAFSKSTGKVWGEEPLLTVQTPISNLKLAANPTSAPYPQAKVKFSRLPEVHRVTLIYNELVGCTIQREAIAICKKYGGTDDADSLHTAIDAILEHGGVVANQLTNWLPDWIN